MICLFRSRIEMGIYTFNWVKKEVKEIYYGTATWTRKIKSVYLWTSSWFQKIRPSWWEPSNHTRLYMPMKTDLLDNSQYHITLTWNNKVTLENWFWKFTAKYWTSNWVSYIAWNLWNMTDTTLSMWIKFWSPSSTSQTTMYPFQMWDSWVQWRLVYDVSWKSLWFNEWAYKKWDKTSITVWTWYHVLFTFASWWLFKWYINNTKIVEYSSTYQQWKQFVLWWLWTPSPDLFSWFTWYMSEVIIEDKIRTDKEITSYYNKLKPNY